VFDGADVVGSESGVHVDRRDALVVSRGAGTVRRRQSRRAFLQVPGFVASLRGARYAERENAVGVTITVAGIRVPSSVA
jgi:hypothetical protein